jgi:hypothetical protein
MPEHRQVVIQAHGQRWSGQWFIQDKEVHLWSAYGGDKAALGRRKPENVAKDLLAECVEAWWNRRDG